MIVNVSDSEISKLAKLREYRVSLNTLAKQSFLQATSFGGGMPLNQLAVFFEVASAQALGSYTTSTDIRLSLELDRRAVSRYLLALSKQGYGGNKGLQLIEFIEDTSDRRTKRVALTRKGEELAMQLAHHLRETAVKHLDHIHYVANQRLADCLFMLGVDVDAGVNVYVVRKPYCYGLFAFMRQCMFSDMQNFNSEHVDLVVIERQFTLTDKEIDQTISNVRPARRSKGSLIVVWLASADNPKLLANNINRRIKKKGLENHISFQRERTSALSRAGLGKNWSYPELFPYE